MTTPRAVRAARDSAVNAVGQIGSLAVSLGTTALLARLLEPADFGLVSLAQVFIGAMLILNDFGLTAVLVRAKSPTAEWISGVFWSNALIGSICFALGALVAPFLAHAYNEPRIEPLTTLMSTLFLTSSLGMVPRTLLLRAGRFREVASATLLGAFANAVTAIGLALLGYGVWSIPLGSLGGNAVVAVYTTIVSRWIPSVRPSFVGIGAALRLGATLSLGGVANFFSTSVDNLVVGRNLGVTALGYYGLAYTTASVPLNRLVGAVNEVLLPGVVGFRDEVTRFRSGIRASVSLLSVCILPPVLIASVAGKTLVVGVFGVQWEQAVFPFSCFVVAAGIKALTSTSGVIFKSMGLGKTEMVWGIALLSTTVVAVLLGSQYGVSPAALAVAAGVSLCRLIMQVHSYHLIGADLRDYVRDILPGTALGVMAAIPVVAVVIRVPAGISGLVIVLFAGVLAVIGSWVLLRGRPRIGEALRTAELMAMRVWKT